MNIKQRTIGLLLALCVYNITLGQIKWGSGDNAPKLEVIKWLQGASGPEFGRDDGKIDIIEFTSIGCPPCIAIGPYLEHLQNEYKGKIRIWNVYIPSPSWTEEESINMVSQHIKEINNGIVNIGVMDNEVSANTWGIRGVPKTILIKNGKIRWIGSPFMLGTVLHYAFTDSLKIGILEVERKEEAFNKFLKAKEKGNYLRAIRGIDSLCSIATNSAEIALWDNRKFYIMVGEDFEGTYELIQELVDTKVPLIVWPKIIGSFGINIPKENRNYKIELNAIDRAIEVSPAWKCFLRTKAKLLTDEMEEHAKALEAIKKAIKAKCQGDFKGIQDLTYYRLYKKERGLNYAYKWLERELNHITITDLLIEDVVDATLDSADSGNTKIVHKLLDKALMEEEKRGNNLNDIRSNKALVYATEGKYVIAHEWLDKTLSVTEPPSSLYLSQKAFICAASKEYEIAIELCYKAIEMDKALAVKNKNIPYNKRYYLKHVEKYERQIENYRTKIKNE